ncbi:MFS transporter [Aurantibacillus circumpalustris]|uniref:MFS transporter n=1 Tax=Aurantibacillus circumpalustris TaxID=3036359 RepID=UPI00295BF89A|nr:MFS transporter [Aurantibacillus circumpalustris]
MNLIEKDNPKTIRAWTFYDWANSVFPLVITSAIFPNFYDYVTTHSGKEFIGHTVQFFGHNFENQNIYSFVYAFALSIVVLIAPILSGIADYLGNKKRFLQFFCYLGSVSCMCLYFFSREHLELSFLPFITATIGFWGSLVYYNSYLPEIASVENQDKVSAKGFSLGYFGSSLLLIVCLIGIMVFKYEETLVDGVLVKTGFFKVKYSFLLTGLWWMGFAQYTFRNLPLRDHKAHGVERKNLLSKGFRELLGVAKQIIKLPRLPRFLSGYFFYNMGVQTVMVVAVLFARNEIAWENEQAKTSSLIISILIIQFVGIAGSYFFSWMSRKTGNIKSLMFAVLIWIFICVFTYVYVRLPMHFYIVAFLVGFVMGGIQSLSRSTYSKLLPQTEDHASFFSFYDVMEKLGMIIGTVTFGLISETMGGMRPAILSLIVYFIIGFVVLFTMRGMAIEGEKG